MRKCILLCLLLLLVPAAGSVASEAIGSIKNVQGESQILRDGSELMALVGATVFERDLIRTGRNASLAVILRDDTIVSLGPESELSLKEYLFEPKENRFSVILKMLKGTFIYMSGVIGKLSPESIQLETPDSTIAVRGTRVMIQVKP